MKSNLSPVKHAYPAILVLLLFVFSQCVAPPGKEALDGFLKPQLIQWNRNLTLVVITDVLTPPVCSRVYAYSNIAAYEVLRLKSPAANPSWSGKLNQLNPIPELTGTQEDYNLDVAAMIAFSTVAQKLVFNSGAVMDLEEQFLKQLDAYRIDKKVLDNSVAYGKKAGQHIATWAAADGYLQRNARPAYIVTRQKGRWIPTPPDYMDAVEPNWNTLRPFSLDSVMQFRPAPPIKFDSLGNSAYFQQVMEVYRAVKDSSAQSVEIAKFWDCNPNISVTQGHVTYFQQKISPAGHWIHIAASVCEKEKFEALKTAQIISSTAIAIADGFISCWEAKYHYNAIRPETVINQYIDKDWRPLLQTPPFPEYPSGHSVVSGSAAVVLSALVRSDYAFTDSTELTFGMPVRHFKSFDEAGREASISRLYGGIHYRQALDLGFRQGQAVGRHLLSRLNLPAKTLP